MSRLPGPELLQQELCYFLQESDLLRPLDSLEQTVVLAYLGGHGVNCSHEDFSSLPATIEGWLAWAAQYSTAG